MFGERFWCNQETLPIGQNAEEFQQMKYFILCPDCGERMQPILDHKLEELYYFCPKCKRTNYDDFELNNITVEDLNDAA